jgi:hypothetical protein
VLEAINQAPYFQSDFSDYTLSIYEDYTYYLPKFSDDDALDQLAFSISSLPGFVELDLENGVYKLLITPNSDPEEVGTYWIEATVTDSDYWRSGTELSASGEFYLTVEETEVVSEDEVEEISEEEEI